MENGEKQSLKESIIEIWAIIKACVTSFWFWVPTLFCIYLYIQLYLMLINPLFLTIVPAILIIYALLWEEKRTKAKYDIKDTKIVYASNPLFTPPQEALAKKAEIDQLVEEYKKMLKKRKEDSAAKD